MDKKSSKRVIFYNPFSAWPFHLETDLELVRDHVEKGDEVMVLVCNRELQICEPNITHDYFTCQACMARRKNGFRLLGLSDKVEFRSFKNLKKDEMKTIDQYQNLELKTILDLKAVKYGSCDIGMAVAASLIDHLREAGPDMSKTVDFVNKSMRSALTVYFSMRNNIKELAPDLLYVFNGRFAALRPALRAAQELGTNVIVHERAGVFGKYTLTQGTYPHDWEVKKQKITETWDNSTLEDEEKIRIGGQWYLDNRFSGRSKQMLQYEVKQEDVLPQGFDPRKFNVVIFSSSEEEFAAISGFENKIYKDQNEGVQRIVEGLRPLSNVHIYLRVHPNLKGVQNSQTRYIESIKGVYQNLTVIGPESPVNSYKLLDVSDIVIAFGSHVGIEAVYFGKISLLVRRTPFEDLGACIRIDSHEELVKVITDRSSNPHQNDDREARKLAAIKYGFFNNVYGYPFKYFQQRGTFDLTYNGHPITAQFGLAHRVLARLYQSYRAVVSVNKEKNI